MNCALRLLSRVTAKPVLIVNYIREEARTETSVFIEPYYLQRTIEEPHIK